MPRLGTVTRAWSWRFRPEPALSLAALRVVVPLMVLLAPGFREGVRVARWDETRWVAPEGLGWFAAHVPIDPWLATAAEVVVAASALMAVLGIYARPALAVLSTVAFYLFSIAQLGGHVWHDMHLLWFSVLLSVSPCDDVLAIDARRPIETADAVYAPHLWTARVLLAVIYFFPGLHKVMRAGMAWALSDNLRNQIYWKWAQYGAVPKFHLETPPWLLPAMGVGVLAFELGFPLFLLSRTARLLIAVGGLVFHLAAQVVLLIPFASLWAAYVVLIDLRPLVPRRWAEVLGGLSPGAPVGAPVAPTPMTHLSKLVCGILVAGAVVQGIRGQTRAYPFACYPTFEWVAGPEMPDSLLVVAAQSDGRDFELPSGAGGRAQREWAEVWSVAGVTAPVTPLRLRAYYDALLSRDPRARGAAGRASAVRFYRVLRSVLPADRGRIVRQTLIGEVTL